MTDKNVVHTMYLLHGLAPFTLWTLAIVAVIIGFMKRNDLRGGYLETHVTWLSRTFWFGLLWGAIFFLIFAVTIVGLLILWVPWGIVTIWYLYRVIKGWLRLNDGQPV